MAELIVTLPTTLAHAILDRLTRQASAVKDVRERARVSVAAGAGGAGAGAVAEPKSPGAEQERLIRVDDEPSPAEVLASDERTTDQIRADLLADMLLTTTPGADPHLPGDGDGPGGLGAIRAVVQVTVPVLTLLGRSDLPADLTGTSPIDPATARTLAGNAPGLDRILTHPITGAVLTTDRYQPTADLKRFLRGRDHRCRFPGCRMPAIRSDIDHTRDYADGGPTEAGNLAHLCRGHHTLKHATPWRVRQLAGGVLEWTSPAGHTYTDHPPGPALPGATAASLVGTGTPPDTGTPPVTGRPSVTFTPDGDPPPF
ncbi:HNH endonuclease [Microbacterium caowuchunii]|uniref:HNH endonuclease n=2 Tax=Microbacterium caowuchunii TaxID=2614638 RepID=A0A5N0TFT2_9MICO|nr:HNH endonuclease [Microbacterium caowuchunii]